MGCAASVATREPDGVGGFAAAEKVQPQWEKKPTPPARKDGGFEVTPTTSSPAWFQRTDSACQLATASVHDEYELGAVLGARFVDKIPHVYLP